MVGYGVSGKGNTSHAYCGIRTEFLDDKVDRDLHKQRECLPISHSPIDHPDRIRESHHDIIRILPWNLRGEIAAQFEE